MNKTLSKFRKLQLFADGGEGASTGAETGATEVAAAPQTGEKKLPITYLDDTDNDVPAAEEQQTANEEPDLDAEFDSLIKKGGKYAEVYEKKFRNALNGRMKENKAQAETLEKSQKVLEKLAQVYGVDASDYEGIEKAIDADDNFYSQAALEAGMSVEAYKELVQARAENAVYKKAREEQVQRERADETYRQWIADSEKVKEIYPGFDLEQEIKNPVFAGLLRNGFPLQNAYEAAHVQELIPQAMHAAVKTASRKIANNVAANRARPTENAGSSNSTATVKRDVDSLTYEEMDEIYELSKKGRITLA